jgi:hypothetical protein
MPNLAKIKKERLKMISELVSGSIRIHPYFQLRVTMCILILVSLSINTLNLALGLENYHLLFL